MRRTSDGFRIAQADLQLRGPGEVFGVRQHGLAGLLVADPISDLPLLEEAKAAAEAWLTRDPDLCGEGSAELAAAVRRRVEGRAMLASGG
jgi:ATP-dependent DNA helicase RecG